MKAIVLAAALLTTSLVKGQQITGLWQSADSSRMYEIKATAVNNFEAVIKSSNRGNDSAGFIIIKELQYNARKKRYEGIMFAQASSQPCFVKIKMAQNELLLKLSRMFIFDAAITWKRTPAYNYANN